MLQGVEANVHAAVLQDGKGAGEQNVEALRNAVVELAKLRQMVESDDAALEVCTCDPVSCWFCLLPPVKLNPCQIARCLHVFYIL